MEIPGQFSAETDSEQPGSPSPSRLPASRRPPRRSLGWLLLAAGEPLLQPPSQGEFANCRLSISVIFACNGATSSAGMRPRISPTSIVANPRLSSPGGRIWRSRSRHPSSPQRCSPIGGSGPGQVGFARLRQADQARFRARSRVERPSASRYSDRRGLRLGWGDLPQSLACRARDHRRPMERAEVLRPRGINRPSRGAIGWEACRARGGGMNRRACSLKPVARRAPSIPGLALTTASSRTSTPSTSARGLRGLCQKPNPGRVGPDCNPFRRRRLLWRQLRAPRSPDATGGDQATKDRCHRRL